VAGATFAVASIAATHASSAETLAEANVRPVRRAYVDIGNPSRQIHYRSLGTGEPLVLLHQTPTSGAEYGRLMPPLAARFRVIAIDTPGYGMSDHLPSDATIEGYAASILAALDRLGIRQFSLFGHHTGAVIAVEMAARAPTRLTALALSGLPAWTAEERREREERTPKVAYRDDGEEAAKRFRAYKRFVAPGAPPSAFYAAFAAAISTGERLHDGHTAVSRYDLLSAFPKVKTRALLLSGERDEFAAQLTSTAKLIPGVAATKIVPGGGLLALEHPDELARAILDFIQP
jgi:pimeloyl-ACP methyl ester carboxylesterase